MHNEACHSQASKDSTRREYSSELRKRGRATTLEFGRILAF